MEVTEKKLFCINRKKNLTWLSRFTFEMIEIFRLRLTVRIIMICHKIIAPERQMTSWIFQHKHISCVSGWGLSLICTNSLNSYRFHMSNFHLVANEPRRQSLSHAKTIPNEIFGRNISRSHERAFRTIRLFLKRSKKKKKSRACIHFPKSSNLASWMAVAWGSLSS